MTLIQDVYNLACELSDDKNLRWGQCCFIALYNIRPDLAKQITGTNIDPFHAPPQHKILEKFWAFVKRNS